MSAYYVADERFPPGSKVTVSDFEPGDYHVCHDWPEHVPDILRGSVHIAGYTEAGVLGEAWIHPSRLTAKEPGFVHGDCGMDVVPLDAHHGAGSWPPMTCPGEGCER